MVAPNPSPYISSSKSGTTNSSEKAFCMAGLSLRRLVRYVSFCGCALLALYWWWFSPCLRGAPAPPVAQMVPNDSVHVVLDAKSRVFPYDRDMPLIFIGGVPRSGTTLMRAMLDAHGEVRCGEETRVIPRLLGMRAQWAKSEKEARRLKEAGVSDEVIDSALAAFILEVIARHGEPAPRLCNKDPFTLKSSVYLSRMFPSSQFVLMVRDGRAVVHSIISRKVTITGFDLTSYHKCLQRWSESLEAMYYQCLEVGPSRCLMVYYEQLVLHPRRTIAQVLDFLHVPWDEAVLHHEEFINKPGGVWLSKTERSTDQVIKPINVEALTKWVPAIEEDVRRDMATLAPMLAKLGYDPHAYPPKYGQADDEVVDRTKSIRQNSEYWKKLGQEVKTVNKPPIRDRNAEGIGNSGNGSILVTGKS